MAWEYPVLLLLTDASSFLRAARTGRGGIWRIREEERRFAEELVARILKNERVRNEVVLLLRPA